MAKALTSRRAPGDPVAEPGLGKKVARKKSRKRRFWKSRGREASKTPGCGPGVAVVRPPKAPEDFSRNWRALQRVRFEGPRGRRQRKTRGAAVRAHGGRNLADRACRGKVSL